MKGYPLYQRGITTLTLLILLSVVLSLFMLFNGDMLRLHSDMAAQRSRYVRQSLHLQRLSAAKEQVCHALSLSETGNSYVITFGGDGNGGRLRHFIRCERLSLFKRLPKTGNNAGLFDQLIAQEHISLFQSRFSPPPTIQPKEKGDYFYWFDATQTEWELKGNIYAVVVALGDLHISGRGRLSGAVITRGKLSNDAAVQIAYRKATVSAIAQSYSRWQRAEKSWNDFTIH